MKALREAFNTAQTESQHNQLEWAAEIADIKQVGCGFCLKFSYFVYILPALSYSRRPYN